MTWRCILSWLAALLLTASIAVGTALGQVDEDRTKKPNEEFRAPVAEVLIAAIATALVLYVVCKPTGKVAS
jgi:hypothetical protein